ncbi:hypothetical protein VroAM7_49120 (plasmid) [Vibrio rotiferianus]|uniref:Lipoprotein n=1 Tax=Vibrio rotiferianus TaxID=190895 RepID=A0A510IEW3_9VIBR|nr:hypothetical protein [Vibrio rotiferianus]BBL92259.1 hypothetical protein VroAM7_49120 [Vibrio rotiferianus]
MDRLFTHARPLFITLTALFSFGCQSTYKSDAEYKQEALTSSPQLTAKYARSIMNNHAKINLADDFTIGRAEYRNQVFGSIATQQAQLAGKPTFAKFNITLTEDMYEGDFDAFRVPFNSVKLEEKGNTQDYDVTVIMTSGLWAEHTSTYMNFAKWNELALKGVTIASLSSTKEIDAENTKNEKTSYFYNLRTPTGIYLPEHANGEYFSTDKRENAQWLDHFFRIGNAGYVRGLEQYVRATPNEAKSLVGKEATAIISILAVFEVGKTGQIVVIGNPINSLLLDPDGHESSGHIEKLYFWDDYMEQSMLEFTHTQTTPYL